MSQHTDSFFLGEWLEENKKIVIGAVAALLLGLAFLWTQLASGAGENDYIAAANQFTLFKKGITNPKTDNANALAALEKLEGMMNKYSVLHQKYDGDIAQLLLAAGMNEKAVPYIEKFQKLNFPAELNDFKTFVQQSLALAQGNHQKAIEISNKLAQTTPDGSPLHAFNKLQLALLEQADGKDQDASIAWQNVKNSLFEAPFLKITPLFTSGNISLSQFIQHESVK